ncbi:MAG: TonB-dependent receptor domain-containing protein [Bacteroidia bacterium]
MLRKIYFLLVLSFFVATGSAFAQSSGSIQGRILDKDTNEPLPFANVVAEMGGAQVGGAQTDFEGRFNIKPLSPGRYNLKASFVGYAPVEIQGVLVSTDKITFQDITMSKGVDIKTVVIEQYRNPLIDKGNPSSQTTITSEEIKVAPTRDVRSVASTTAGVYQQDEGEALNIRGSRDNSTEYYIDGIKVRGSTNIPQAGIEQITVVQGGIPAQYGDATGGIINITTRGPSKDFNGGLELVSSDLFDEYNYRLASLNLSGPILMKREGGVKTQQPILGFFLSGEYQDERDPDPSAIGMWKVKDDILADLQANPTYPVQTPAGLAIRARAQLLTMDDLEQIKYRQNTQSTSFRLNGKIDFVPIQNINLTFGGTFDRNDQHDYIYTYQLFNPGNQPQTIDNTWRVFGRFTQKFSSGEADTQTSASTIKNAYYSLQVDYSKFDRLRQDDSHEDRLFNYGYIGKFDVTRVTPYSGEIDINGDTIFTQAGVPFSNTVTFTPSDINPQSTAYTTQYFDFVNGNVSSLSQIQQAGALRNGDRPVNPTTVYSLWFNSGREYNTYLLQDQNQYRLSAMGSADIKNHAIMIGFEYEQRSDRAYQILPVQLWTAMRQRANAKNNELDLSSPDVNVLPNGTTIINYPLLYSNDGSIGFYENIRTRLGLSMNEWVNIDAYTPDQFSLDLFTPDELYDNNLLPTVYGYDYLGNKTTGRPSLTDYFTQRDENNNFTRPMGAFEPIYMAGYIQDKFAFQDLIFNVGVRVDRYDANQPVLRDKYVLFPAYTVGELRAQGLPLYDDAGNEISAPGNIGDDFVVYIKDLTAINPVPAGYRFEDTWYNSDGEIINDPKLISDLSGGRVVPYLVDYKTDPKLRDNLTEASFTDYDPQITVMPRIAFSFPISDEALFFAHYDILTQRPQSRTRFDPSNYLYLEDRSGTAITNPDLKPERTTSYELGFKQRITRSSAITLSAFYREFRDQIQIKSVLYAYPTNYLTFENEDFGTAKGLSFGFDLRRTNNVRLTANYTLQFADGTGSGDVTALNLVNSGMPNLRTLMPLDFDQRHTLVATVDFRYGSGAEYNGPTWFNSQFFSNTGLNFIFRAGSGVPYTRQSNVTQEGAFGIVQQQVLAGSINGARLPWNFRIDAKLDKDFDIKFGNREGARSAYINAYILVQNLLDADNIINVYRSTGNPGDDGYLTAAESQVSIAGLACPECFRDLYSIKVNNPDNYSLPRRARLGVSLNF